MYTTTNLPDAAQTSAATDAQRTTAAYPDPTSAPASASASWVAGSADQPGQTGQFGQAFSVGSGAPAQAAPRAAARLDPDPETTRIFSIVSFVLGIASIAAGWTFIAPIAGLIFGILALRRGTAERTLTLWGVWLNAVMLAFSAFAMLLGIAFLGLGLFATFPFAFIL